MTYVSLIISNGSLKILSLTGRQVKKWGSLALKAGLVRDGLILEPQAVGEAIDELFKSTGVRKENVAVSLAGLSFTYRFLKFPRMKPALLDEAILRAARKEMSLPLEELYLSWQPIPGKGDEQSYFILGVPRNPVDAVLRTLGLAGIEPYTLELQPLALARAANRRDAIVVSLEPDCYSIVFMADGFPGVIHTISPRGEGATLDDNIRRLADELAKTAAFYQSSHPESRLAPAEPLLITGELASETPASGLLQAEVDYPVEPLVPPVEFPPGAPVASYAISAGLALNNTSRKIAGRSRDGFVDININILSGKYRKIRGKSVPASKIWLGIILAMAVIFLFPLHQTLNNLKSKNTDLEDEARLVNRNLTLAQLVATETSTTEEDIQVTINSTKALKTVNQSLLGNRGGFTRDLLAVNAARPADIRATSIEIDSSQITVRGETGSVFSVVIYATALEITPFQDVRISRLDEAPLAANNADNTESSSNVTSTIIFEIVIKK